MILSTTIKLSSFSYFQLVKKLNKNVRNGIQRSKKNEDIPPENINA